MAGIAFVAAHWPKADRDWLRDLGTSAPREAVFVLELVGTFEATPLDSLARAVLQFSNTGG